jgi:hypothetical protein
LHIQNSSRAEKGSKGHRPEYKCEQARTRFRMAARLLQGGGLLIGVDLVKEPSVLHAAYNDSRDVTGAFNLNLLRRMNAELAADFDVEGFSHYAFYQAAQQRVEMHLVSRRRQTVRRRRFHSHGGVPQVHRRQPSCARRGRRFSASPVWIDERRLFSVHWLIAPSA